ncbi:hypothetical protein C8R44DRAFT_741851 [Mycena epipterygia]|nr:hypothetical protein C8R44DRAFT_741851 [Mycena epipterygia]
MAQLLRERDKALEVVSQYSGVLSPIRRVPPELISEVFSWTSPHTRKIGKNTVVQPPWHLGHIYGSWRDTAIAYPLLWNSFNILHSPEHPHENTFPLSMIETQLLRLLDLLQPVKGRLTQLQRMEFVDCAQGDVTAEELEESCLSDIFSTAPNLREVLLTGPDFTEYSPVLAIPWRQITRYRGVYSVRWQLDILDSAPNIIACGIASDFYTIH